MNTPCEDPGHASASIPELIAAIALGDETAFTTFHELYWKRIYAYLMVLSKGNASLAADLAQVTMIRAARHLRSMETETALWAWLSRVARNAFIDVYRAESRQPSFVEIQENDLLTKDDSQDSDSGLLTALDEALLALSPNERNLIEETYLNARRQSDLASELGLSLKALESRLTRLRKKLRQLILFPPRDE